MAPQYAVLIEVMVTLAVVAARVALACLVLAGAAKTLNQPPCDITQSLFDGSSGKS